MTRISEYEKRVKHKKMEIKKKITRDDGLILLISQGACPKGDNEDPVPHYKIEYAVFRDMEFADLAEFYTIPFSPITTMDDRLKTAELRANEMIKHLKKTGRYG